MNKACLLLWLVAGVITLIRGDIGRLEYSLAWGMLILKYIESINWDERKKRIMQQLDELKFLVLRNIESIDEATWPKED